MEPARMNEAQLTKEQINNRMEFKKAVIQRLSEEPKVATNEPVIPSKELLNRILKLIKENNNYLQSASDR